MRKLKKEVQSEQINLEEQVEEKKSFLEKNKRTLKDIIAPAGVDAS